MSWRNINLCSSHAAQDAGLSALSASHALETGSSLGFLIDGLIGPLCTFATAQENSYIDLDRGATDEPVVDRLIIPAGHNLNGKTIIVYYDTEPTFAAPVTTAGTVAVTSDDLISLTLSLSTGIRYIRFKVTTSCRPRIPELIYTFDYPANSDVLIDRGPEQGWDDGINFSVVRSELPGSMEALVLADSQREMEVNLRRIAGSASNTDYRQLNNFLDAVSTNRIIVVDTPWDGDDAGETFLAKILSVSRRTESSAPSEWRNMDYTLRFREVVA